MGRGGACSSQQPSSGVPSLSQGGQGGGQRRGGREEPASLGILAKLSLPPTPFL